LEIKEINMDIIREPNLTRRKIKKRTPVLLKEKWSAWNAGQVIEIEAEKAKRVIAKGYGEVFKPSKKQKVETATAPPPPENQSAAPEKKESVKETADMPKKKE
jgi:hypothetical protein